MPDIAAGPAAELDFPFEKPAAGTVTRVADGVFWLRLPLPFRLNHVNVWILDDGPTWTVIDTGIGTDACRDAWDLALSGHLGGKPVGRVIVTHMHPDHIGLAGRFEQHGAAIHMPRTEWLMAQANLAAANPVYRAAAEAYYRRLGLPADTAYIVAQHLLGYIESVTPLPTSFERVMDGDEISIGGRSWNVLIGRGHAAEMAMLLCRGAGLLIAADQILPTISPHVSVWPYQPTDDPLAVFLEDLQRFRRLPPDLLVLPSHGLPFRGLHARIDVLAHHHAERLDAAAASCGAGATAAQVMARLFDRELDEHEQFFAVGETVSHLNRLERLGRITVDRQSAVNEYRVGPQA